LIEIAATNLIIVRAVIEDKTCIIISNAVALNDVIVCVVEDSNTTRIIILNEITLRGRTTNNIRSTVADEYPTAVVNSEGIVCDEVLTVSTNNCQTSVIVCHIANAI